MPTRSGASKDDGLLPKNKGRAVRVDAPPLSSSDVRSALLEAIILMAGAAVVLADIAERRLEAVHVLDAGGRGFGVLAEFDEPRLEVGHVFPNFWAGVELVAGIAVFGIVGVKARHLRRRVLELRKRLGHRSLIVRLLAFGHVGENFGLIAVGLHQRFARFDRVFLGHGNAGAERNGGHGGNGEHSTNHVVVSLSGDVGWAESSVGSEGYGRDSPRCRAPWQQYPATNTSIMTLFRDRASRAAA